MQWTISRGKCIDHPRKYRGQQRRRRLLVLYIESKNEFSRNSLHLSLCSIEAAAVENSVSNKSSSTAHRAHVPKQIAGDVRRDTAESLQNSTLYTRRKLRFQNTRNLHFLAAAAAVPLYTYSSSRAWTPLYIYIQHRNKSPGVTRLHWLYICAEKIIEKKKNRVPYVYIWIEEINCFLQFYEN